MKNQKTIRLEDLEVPHTSQLDEQVETHTYTQEAPQQPIMIQEYGAPMDGFSVWVAAMILKMSVVLAFGLTTWVSLRLLDKLGGISFREWINNAHESNQTIYFAVRFGAVVLGAAIVFAFGGGL